MLKVTAITISAAIRHSELISQANTSIQYLISLAQIGQLIES